MVEVMHIYFTGRGLKKNKKVSFYNVLSVLYVIDESDRIGNVRRDVSDLAIFDLVTYETERL